MEESNEGQRVIPELYFLIAKFLSGGPLKETAQTLLKELERVEVLPRRLDWEGNEHAQSYDELANQYADIPWSRLAAVCLRTLQLAPGPFEASRGPSEASRGPSEASRGPSEASQASKALVARLSLLSESLVRPKPKHSVYKEDHSIVRRLLSRSEGRWGAGLPGGRGGPSLMSPRLLCGLQLQRRTLGHLSAVYCVVFDTSGRYVLTGADDLLVKVWSAIDGRLVATLRGAAAEITDACVSADGALLAAGSVERLVRVWCLQTAAPRAVLHAHAGTITSVHWAPPGEPDVRWLASTSTDGSVAFWTCSKDGQFLSQPVQYVERMRPGACHMICAAWSAGGGFLAAGSADHHVRVYMIAGGAPRRVLEVAVHSDAVDSIAWAHRGLRFVSGSKDGSAAVWSLYATQWRHTVLRCQPSESLPQEKDKRLKVTMVCWDCTDAYILTAVSDCTVRVWCARSCVEVRILKGHRDEAYVLEAHPLLGGVVLSAGHDGQLLVWDAPRGELLATFHNNIQGQGDGAIFDAKWGGATSIAATDSHGHVLLLGLGKGHPLLSELPTELFFHTDYRPLVRDALGGALDEQTETPPHLMAPPFLVDVEGAPHLPYFQRLVPGRENLALHQLIPAAEAQPSRLDLMIEALAADRTPPTGDGEGAGEARGMWRGEGVRHTAGSWHSGEPAPHCSSAIVPPLHPAHIHRLEKTCAEVNLWEQAWYRREMRRRPVMISTAPDGGPRRKPGRRPAPRARPPPPAPPPRPERIPAVAVSNSESEQWSAHSSASSPLRSPPSRSRSRRSPHSPRSPPHRRGSRRRREPRRSSLDSDSSCSYTSGKTEESSESSYSDWEAGAELAPPARARRRPVPTKRSKPPLPRIRTKNAIVKPSGFEDIANTTNASMESYIMPRSRLKSLIAKHECPGCQDSVATVYNEYSPSTVVNKRTTTQQSPNVSPTAGTSVSASTSAVQSGVELPEAYRPGEWLCAVSPRKAPYHPQMGDQCLYFRLGHQRYFEAVSEKDVYKVNPRDKPWERTTINECELVKVVGIKYVIKPPRIVCLRLACVNDNERAKTRTFTVKYHDMPDVIDFLVLKQQYDTAVSRHWGQGDRFRCMIDDSWWTGVVLESSSRGGGGGGGEEGWAGRAAAHFLSLRVRWDNGEVERLSPWDLEPLDPDRLPSEPGGSVAVLPHELEAVLYSSERDEWPPRGDRAAAATTVAQHISQVMSLSVAEPFVAPVDLQLYPSYAMVVPYPIDLATIRARFENLFYRRIAAAQFDVRYLASNAEQFNEPHSPIVRQARLVTDLLLHIISNWHNVDVVGKYHELAAAYHSSDDEPLANNASHKSNRSRRRQPPTKDWRAVCREVLNDLLNSPDAGPFRAPVSSEQAPDYRLVVARPMDLNTISRKLELGRYSRPARFASDMRLVFSNSRLYNTNKRSRIFSMTVRLSSLFESLWTRAAPTPPTPRTPRTPRYPRTPRTHRAGTHAEEQPNGENGNDYFSSSQHSAESDSDSETLAAASRRVHASRRADSWDSDVPLHKHRKGKGVGKKSKSSSASAEPVAGTSRDIHEDQYLPSRNGVASSSSDEALSRIRGAGAGLDVRATHSDSDGSYRDIQVLDEEIDHYNTNQNARKRRRASTASSGTEHVPRPRRRRRRRFAPHKRTRERITDGSSSSSASSASAASARSSGRYESDRSYKPRYSTDDDAPLHVYRQRHTEEDDDEAGPSTGSRRSHSHRNTRGGVSLRARVSARRYNEDSEEDSLAAISKRGPQLRHGLPHTAQRLHATRRLHATQSARATSGGSGAHSSAQTDHNYYTPATQHNGNENGVSISSRGRVRKLTAKARGLLHE